MTKISNKTAYPIKEYPTLKDNVVGTDSENSNKTVTYSFDSVLNLMNTINMPIRFIYINSSPPLGITGAGYFLSDLTTDISSISEIYISNKLKSNDDLSQTFDFIGENPTRYSVRLQNMSDPNNFVLWNITSVTDNETYYTFGVELTDDEVFLGTFTPGDTYGFMFELIVPDATTSKKGIVQLAGDLTGTASAPTIKSSVNLTGVPTAPTASLGTNTTQLATTAFVTAEITDRATPDATTLIKGKVQLAGDLTGTAALPTIKSSVSLTGIPLAPTATAGTNTTQIATTAFVLENSINIPFLEFNNTDKTVWNNGQGNIFTNTSFGDLVLGQNSTGQNNSGFGRQSLENNTTGNYNTSVGAFSLSSNTEGSNNTVVGNEAMSGNETGNGNTAIGAESLSSNFTGNNNTAIGYQTDFNSALSQLNNVTVIGYGAKAYFSDTMNFGNSSIIQNNFNGEVHADSFVKEGGLSSEYLMADGSVTSGITPLEFNNTDKTVWNNGKGDNDSNTEFGVASFISNTAGVNNSVFGYMGLYSNTEGEGNIAFGNTALYSNTTGSFNTALGLNTLVYCVSASRNTAVGTNSLKNVLNNYNTAIGYDSGRFFDDGLTSNNESTNSTYLGALTKASSLSSTNEIAIGYDVTGNGSNTVTIGNDDIINNYFNGNIVGDTFVKRGGTSSQYLMADGSVTTPLYSVYTAALSQSGTGNPIQIAFQDTIGIYGVHNWNRIGVGQYKLTITGAFLYAKTYLNVGSINSDGIKMTSLTRLSDNELLISSFDGSGLADGILDGTCIEIRVYL